MNSRVQLPNADNPDIPVYNLVAARQALKTTLPDITRYHITIVSAPPGYGKTTAVADFVRSIDIPAAWHSLQERERDLSALYWHSLQALEFIAPGISIAAAELTSPDECAAYIANYLREHVNRPTLYVMDDLQLIAASPSAERWLRELVRHLPSNCHLVLISRTLPDLPLAELIAKGDVLAIGQEHLRFSVEDAAALAAQMNIALPDDTLEDRIQQLEGWPVGVAMSLRPLPVDLQIGLLRGSGGPEALFDALAARILNALPPVLTDFLLTASIVSRVTPEICNDVLHLPHSTGLMTDIVRRNLFASQIAGGLTLHRLFRNFLQRRLQEIDPERFIRLHTLAADWHRDQHQDDEAFHHYMAAGRTDEALAIVGRTHNAYFKQGNAETLLRWRAMLAEHAERLPQFVYTCAMILTDRYAYGDALAELACAETGFEAQGDRAWVAEARLQRAMIHIWQANYRAALALTQPIAADKKLKETTVGRAQHLLAMIDLANGDLDAAIARLEAILPIFEGTNDSYYVSGVLLDLAVAHTTGGNMTAASHYLQRLVAIRRTLGQPNALALALNNLGYHYHQIGDYELALRTLDEGLQVVGQNVNQRSESYLRWSMGDLQRDLGNFDEALRLYENAYELNGGAEQSLQQSITLSTATLYRWRGEYQMAARLTRELAAGYIPGEARHSMITLMAQASIYTLNTLTNQDTPGPAAFGALLEELAGKPIASEYVQIALLAASAVLLDGDETCAGDYLRGCLDACEQGVGRNIVAAEIANTPHLAAFVDANPEFRPLQSAVQRLRSARRTLSASPPRDASEVETRTYTIHVRVLGDEFIECDNKPVATAEWRSSRAKEFFLYLLFEGAARREQISLVFWPDSSSSRVRSNFHTTLYRARRALGDNVILYEDDIYRINPEVNVWCDAVVFERYVTQAKMLPYSDVHADDLYRKAIAYYQGEFLPSLDAEWITPRREALYEMYIAALIGAGQCARARGDYTEAVGLFKRALKTDPFREEAHRALLSCYASMGEVSRVFKHFDLMKSRFMDELGVLPSPETHAYVQQLTRHMSLSSPK